MDYSVIIKIAAIGILTAVVSQVLKSIGKDEIATFATLAGLVIVLIMCVNMISELFDTVKLLFLM
ncbi:MAG: stage III sporulation protein AC [Clostridia bacterium]|nr:stage III sporulation protein AC [Clostridia bacterium]